MVRLLSSSCLSLVMAWLVSGCNQNGQKNKEPTPTYAKTEAKKEPTPTHTESVAKEPTIKQENASPKSIQQKPEEDKKGERPVGEIYRFRIRGANNFTAKLFVRFAISSNGKFALSGDGYGGVHLYDLTDGEHLHTFSHINGIDQIAFASNNKLALSFSGVTKISFGNPVPASRPDWPIMVWDLEKRAEFKKLEATGEFVNAACFSPDGRFVLAAYSKPYKVRLWDLDTCKEVFVKPSATEITRLAFSPDGKHFLTGNARISEQNAENVSLWSTDAAKIIQQFENHKGQLSHLAFSADGSRALTAYRDLSKKMPRSVYVARLWNVQTGKSINQFEANVIRVFPDQNQFATASEKSMVLCDFVSGEPQTSFEESAGELYALGFSPTNHRLLTIAKDNVLRIWDSKTGKQMHNYPLKCDGVFFSQIQVSPDARKGYFFAEDHVLAWQLPSDHNGARSH